MKIFDTHAHFDLLSSERDIEFVINRSLNGTFPPNTIAIGEFSLAGIILPGISRQSSESVIRIAEKSAILYPAVGIHPNSAGEIEHEDWEVICQLAHQTNVVAIGETGLDLYWKNTPFEIQLDYFLRHLNLAISTKLPVIIHSRDCDQEMLSTLNKLPYPIRGVIHSFSSTPDVVKHYLEMGLYVSFAGAITYTNKKFAPLWEAAKMIPDDRLLVETDSPYLTPHPYRGKIEANEPILAAYIIRRLAELRQQSLEHVAAMTTENAKKLFAIS